MTITERHERQRQLQAAADRRAGLLANPPDTTMIRCNDFGCGCAYDEAADWIAAVTATNPPPPPAPGPARTDTEWVPLTEAVGRIATVGNRGPLWEIVATKMDGRVYTLGAFMFWATDYNASGALVVEVVK